MRWGASRDKHIRRLIGRAEIKKTVMFRINAGLIPCCREYGIIVFVTGLCLSQKNYPGIIATGVRLRAAPIPMGGRKHRMKRTLSIFFVFLFLAGPAALADSSDFIRGFNKSDRWQYVTYGSYPYESDGTVRPVLWRVLGVENGQALMLSEYVIDLQQAIYCDNQKDSEKRNFRRITDYAQSDLNTWMNTEMLNKMFLATEQDSLSETAFGKIYPLTKAQYMTPAYGFSAAEYGVFKERQAKATPYAKTLELFPGSEKWSSPKKLYVDRSYGSSPHWVAYLRNPNENGIMLQLCGYDGHLSYGVYSRRDVGVRPAVTVLLDRVEVISGSGVRDDPLVLSLIKADPQS